MRPATHGWIAVCTLTLIFGQQLSHITGGLLCADEPQEQQICQGHDPDVEITVPTSGGLSADWTERQYKPADLWGYQPVRKPATDVAGSPAIDELINDRIPAGLTIAPRADRRTLIRRATFDLTGLPPSMAEVSEFLRDSRSDQEAFSALVDRLLQSPHYGERMAQHWLDIVRYADSSGFANDYERGNAWRYRDYVVRAFNSDKPFNDFVREQIAGDEIDPANPEMLIAVGFLRMGPWELTSMEVARIARQRFLDDVTNSVGETFLAHSLQCARCHDHKFDPVPSRDYYSVQAAFATTQMTERSAPFLVQENVQGFEERRFAELRRDEFTATLNRLDRQLLDAAIQWFDEHQLSPEHWLKAVEQISEQNRKKGNQSFFDVFSATRNLLRNEGVEESQYPPKYIGFSPQDFGIDRVARKGLERLRWEFDRYEPMALSVYSGPTPDVKSVSAPVRLPELTQRIGEVEATAILIGGDPFEPGDNVTPGALSALNTILPSALNTSDIEGRRLRLAQWISDERNPLTTRTIVNRVWHWHFGQPIAGNPNNFGSTGKRPTHPELLDWLAATLVEKRWSVRTLHRLIMNTDVYCRSSQHPNPDDLERLDPVSTSYAAFQMRRLSAEEIRDAMLIATEELNPMLGGIPNRPEIHPEVATQPRQVMGTFASAWVPNALPSQRHRRSLYALKLRGLPDPVREVFDAPSADFSCERREQSVTTPQVFSLFNNQSVHTRALVLAHSALARAESDQEALESCFLRTLQRPPDPDELALCLKHWADSETTSEAVVHSEPPPIELHRTAVEENTGEKFSFVEPLYESREFVSDLQPENTDSHTRALAEVCLVLFNCNEFLHID